MNKNILTSFIILIVAIVATTGCAKKKVDVKPSPMVEKAIATATEAAKKVVATDHSDTLAMQNAILEAKTMQAEFQVAEDTAAINSYNRAFKKYLQENDPDLAKDMFIERPKNHPKGEIWDEFEQLVEVTNTEVS